jgi:SAM-dependent methyltransferase
MTTLTRIRSTSNPPTSPATDAQQGGTTGDRRLDCLVCDHRIDPGDESLFVTFPCHVRAFLGETFKVWRCAHCRTIHCLDVVDLDHYYAKYPFAGMQLTWPFRIFYRNLARRLTRYGFSRDRSLLDYGCGSGIFVKYLRRRGFTKCHGYDPYGPPDTTGNPAILQHAPFEHILLQDVLEHVENPDALLSELNGTLAPGGHVLVGTPNAANLDLARPEDFWNEVHVPYHLHIYTRNTVEDMGRRQGWIPVGFFDRPYHDRPWFGLNARASRCYQQLADGTIDSVLEPIRLWKALLSPKFLFYAKFGYWLSHKSDMTVVFCKSKPKSILLASSTSRASFGPPAPSTVQALDRISRSAPRPQAHDRQAALRKSHLFMTSRGLETAS